MDKLEQCIKDISNNYYEYLMNLENVNGVAYGYKYINNKNTFEPCINVLVENKIYKNYLTKNNVIPKTYMGLSTDVVEFGRIKANALGGDYEIGFDTKMRPLTGGCAIRILGNLNDKKAIGSMCCIVKKKSLKENKNNYYLLSTNNVLAYNGQNPIGSVVIQPAELTSETYSQSALIVAVIDEFIPIRFIKSNGSLKKPNSIDCCIAKLIKNSLMSPFFFSYSKQGGLEFYDVDKFTGVTKAFLGMYIKQYGAESGKKEGQVNLLHGTFNIDIDDKTAIFTEQIGIDLESKQGDRGAPVLSRKSNKIIGMNIGGSETGTTICNDINVIFDLLNVELYIGE